MQRSPEGAAINYYERHLGDYARDTAHLTMVEHGAYTLLLDRYYATEAPIPADQAHRVARARTKEERAAVDAVLAEFFTLEDGAWKSRRADAEIAKARVRIDAAQSNGKRGGRPRKETQQKPSGFSLGSETGTQPKAHQTPDTRHQRESKDDALTCIANSPVGEPATNVIPADELDGRRKRSVIACPVAKIADLWDEVLPELASPIVWSEARKSAVSARWREMAVFHGWKTQDEGIDWFRRTLVAIRGSPFLMGKVPPRERNSKPFALTLDWMFGPKNFLKVVEGRYHEQ